MSEEVPPRTRATPDPQMEFVPASETSHRLTRSSLVVGLVSLAELIPILLMSFVGGALADAVDRRRMVRITQASACVWTRAVRHHGRAIAFAAAGWGVAIVVFGLASSLWIALLALAFAGAADMISGLFRSTLWNQTIPDAMRGRLAGIEMISHTSGPALGNLEAGVVGSLAGVRASVVSGGILCVVGTAVLSAVLPQFWRYRATP